MHAYSTADWGTFFGAEAGASAALAGLVFVAVSVNLQKILDSQLLRERAVKSTGNLIAVLLIATVGLAPGQPSQVFAAELIVIGLTDWAVTTLVDWRAIRNRGTARAASTARIFRVASNQMATLPFALAGISLLLGRWGGLYWVLLGVLFTFAASSTNAGLLLFPERTKTALPKESAAPAKPT
jgi:hypothetical protein